MAILAIRLFSHHFEVKTQHQAGIEICRRFIKQFHQYGMIREGWKNRWGIVKTFAFCSRDEYEWRFNINARADFMRMLKANGYSTLDYTVEIVPLPAEQSIDMEVRDIFVPKPNQELALAYLADMEAKKLTRTKLIEFQMGAGKTVTACFDIERTAVRTVLFCKAGYTRKWQLELVNKYTNMTKEEVVILRGLDAIKKAIRQRKEKKQKRIKFFIIPTRTMQLWLADYYRLGEYSFKKKYGIMPYELLPTLGIGYKLVDEVHQEFHALFMIELFTHVRNYTALSGTLVTMDSFLQNMHRLSFPLNIRMPPLPIKKYTKSYATYWDLKSLKGIKTSEAGSNTYSHLAFEESILSQKTLLQGYLQLIYTVARKAYFHIEHPKKQLLIFAARVDMCTLIVQYFKNIHPELNVVRFVEEDPLEEALKGDVIVTTLGKSGTAIDYPHVISVIQTTAVDSISTNQQSFGRPREIPGLVTTWYFFVCVSIATQVRYAMNKQDWLLHYALEQDVYDTGIVIG